MDYSKAKAWIDANGERLRDAMGLRHWVVTFRLERLDGQARFPGATCLGECNTQPDYNRAVITIDHDEIDDEAELERVATHEMLHVVLSPLNVYRDYRNQGVEADSPDADRNQVIWDYFIEQAIVNLERLWEHRGEFRLQATGNSPGSVDCQTQGNGRPADRLIPEGIP